MSAIRTEMKRESRGFEPHMEYSRPGYVLKLQPMLGYPSLVKGSDSSPDVFVRAGSNPVPSTPAPIAQSVERRAYNVCYPKMGQTINALYDTRKSWVRSPLGALTRPNQVYKLIFLRYFNRNKYLNNV